MTGVHLVTSNRLEILAAELAALVRTPLDSPLAPEIIVVQSRGMERWVSMELARANGICANIQWPFPNAFLEMVFETLSPGLPGWAVFDPEVLAFRIMRLITECCERADFKPLADYLKEDIRGVKCFQLARQIADLFDQYLLFRPEMIERWEQGPPPSSEPHRWQALIWRELAHRTPGRHRVDQGRRLVQALRTGTLDPRDLPQRVSIFGVSYLPKFHLEMLAALSGVIEVYLFYLNPCREYWGDIVSLSDAHRTHRWLGAGALDENSLYLERGHRLLASLGTQGRHFLNLLADVEAHHLETFAEPTGDSLLQRLQSDILHLRAPQSLRGGAVDESIQIHACHSPMREIEVLQDQLLAMFSEDSRLQAVDVIVMAPDIEAYAPFISAVFGSPDSAERRIPFHLADRGPHRENRLWRSFMGLLDLPACRLTVSEVLRLLESPGILERFGLEDLHLPRLEQWVRAAGICWGEAETTLRDLGLPGYAQNTWKTGLERLLLGYALPAEGNECFQGLRGPNVVEGSEARVLGGFLDFLEQVFSWSVRLRQPRRLSVWAGELNALLSDFFIENERNASDIQHLRRVLEELAALEAASEFTEEVVLEVPRVFLTERLETQGPGRRFMSGGVTFCAMLPMRAIPFKVVCLIGMNDASFPRENRLVTFDLMAQAPRPGDRSRRNDDQYLFLEAILAARQRLYISYVGQNLLDNSLMPPSVVVSELIDTLQTEYGLPVDDPAHPLVTRHPLQPFSRAYFESGSPLFSFSTEDREICAAAASRSIPPAFAFDPVRLTAEEEAAWRRVDLDQLAAFFGHPVRFFFKQRLGASFDLPEFSASDSEPFDLKGLERFQLGRRLLEQRRMGEDSQAVFRALQAEGRLPHGTMGEVAFQRLWSEVDRFARRFEALFSTVSPTVLETQWDIGGFRVTARLDGVAEHGCWKYRFGRLRPKDRLELWLQHVGACLAKPGASVGESVLFCTDATLRVRRPPDPRSVLEGFLTAYRQGLERPLRFFPGVSWEYATTLRRTSHESQALAAARRRWEGSEFSPGEGEDPYCRRCFEGVDPLDREFQELSRALVLPLLECASEERVA
jgi:exodeoxyribonuclease V gamma subunit